MGMNNHIVDANKMATPRTDAEACWPAAYDDSDTFSVDGGYVVSSFARTLERELNTATIERDQARREIEELELERDKALAEISSWQDQCDQRTKDAVEFGRQLDEAQARVAELEAWIVGLSETKASADKWVYFGPAKPEGLKCCWAF